VSDLALLVKLQARVATFLADLSADQLLALAEGRLSLIVADAGSAASPATHVPLSAAAAPVPPVPAEIPQQPRSPARKARARTAPAKAEPIDAGAVVAQLKAAETIVEATERLVSLKLRAEDLRLVAKELSIPVGGTKAELERRILNITVGSRSKHAGLRQG
jgi:hypothetical protein